MNLYITVFIILTVAKPMPYIFENNAIVYRLMDFVWFLILIILLLKSMYFKSIRNYRVNLIIIFLFMSFVSVLLSLLLSPMVTDNDLILSDFFELFRPIFYILVFWFSTRNSWDQNDVICLFFKPLLWLLIYVFIISILQGFNLNLRHVVSYIYTTKTSIAAMYGDSLFVRNSGTFTNSNYFGIFLSIVTPFVISAMLMFETWKDRLLSILVFCLIPVFVIIAGSRTGLLMYLLCCVMYGVLSLGEVFFVSIKNNLFVTLLKKYITINILFLIILFFLAIQSNNLFRIKQAFSTIESDGFMSVDSIDVKYNSSIRIIKDVYDDHLFFGIGPSKSYDKYLGDTQYSKVFIRYGLFGLFIYFFMNISILIIFFKRYLIGRSVLSLLLSKSMIISSILFILSGLTADIYEFLQIGSLYLLIVGVCYSFNDSNCDNLCKKRF